MLKNTYILYINDERSIKYKDDCVRSISKFPNLNPIPVQGYKLTPYETIQNELGINIIPHYLEKLEQGSKTDLGALCCSAGHFKIWNLIVESGEPGVVLEHDAIVKYDYSGMKPKDGEILWLGPRIDLEYDYNVPENPEYVYLELDRFEGTHAYAVTPATAQYLIDQFKRYGFNDSLDGQLSMRNIFEVKMGTIDPPPVVAVVGDRESCIETSGNPGFWNAYNTERFVSYLRPGCKIPPERRLLFSNKSFDKHTNELKRIVTAHGLTDGSERAVLIIGGYEGYSTNWFSNLLLEHPDSQLHAVSQFRNTTEQKEGEWPQQDLEQIFRFNTYFSWYYYKLNLIPVEKESLLLAASILDPDIRFDLIYVDGNHEFKEVLYDSIVSWNLLKPNGLLIFDDMINNTVSKAVDIFARTIYKKPIYNGNFSVFVKD